jgi:hypothetical protein
LIIKFKFIFNYFNQLVGVGATVVTGGALAAVIAGASFIGAGSSMIFNPIQKTLAKERMSVKDLRNDALLGGTIGAITGPIGNFLILFCRFFLSFYLIYNLQI